ncbi:putative carbohydrate esterase family 4 protein [Phaeomoniella chlamydospora]|uniref:Putative carbohydrate esterase family 4 protein n=1 Tax=Phaeomoniella chlamydospora TaxID=158046 RepID=A0A0G2EGP4_PHACM|nr:putative carbohydrate esterase family 4 protein [Phaeomoniella chlamydospora]
MPSSASAKTKWPSSARAAICLTLDNMGEAADLNRNLWPSDQPIGSHYSVTAVLPQILSLLDKYQIPATYFTETWNVDIYPSTLRELVRRGHEVAWHAFQHEAWAKLGEKEEEGNFERSFEGIGKLAKGDEEPQVPKYRGFRPPGGIINQGRTLELCKRYGLRYLSPAAHDAGYVVVVVGGDDDDEENQETVAEKSTTDNIIVILPFKWSTVDAYYYMTTFGGLRKIKHEPNPSDPLPPTELKKRYIAEIDATIEKGGFLAPLFHPFLSNEKDRLEVVEEVLKYLSEKRDRGEVWLAKCEEVDEWIRGHREGFGGDVGWDLSSWR